MNRSISRTKLFTAPVHTPHSKQPAGGCRRFGARLFACAGLLAIGFANAPSAALAADPISIKIATLAPEGTAWIRILRANTAEIEKRLEGRVKFTIYGSGVQGSEKIIVDKMKTGQLQGGALTVIGLSTILPELMAFNLPVVFDGTEEMDGTREQMEADLDKKIWDAGFKMVNWGGMGAFYLFSNEPVRRPKDLLERRVWVWNDDPVFNEMALEIGAAPIPLALPDVLSALDTGQVDTVLMHGFALISLQWFTRMSYRLEVPILYGVGGLAIVRDVWEKLTSADRQVFSEVNAKWSKVHVEKTLRDNAKALELLDSQGVEIVTPSDAEMEDWQRVSERTWERLQGRVYSEKLLRDMLQHRDQYRKASTP
jgi:TRAP-type C4-dicarboxylate transport system substrate-binding protein